MRLTQRRQHESLIEKTMLALACAIYFLGGAFSYAQDEPALNLIAPVPEVENLADGRDAENFANDLLLPEAFDGETKIENPANRHYIFYHFGNKIPKQLKWIILKLSAKHISFEVVQITEAQANLVFETLQTEADTNIVGLSYQKRGEHYQKQNTFEDISTIKLMWRQLFGLAEGATYLAKVDRSRSEVKTDALLAGLQVISAAFNTAVSLYLKAHEKDFATHNLPYPNIMLATAAMMSWVAFTQYNKLRINETLRQGKVIKVDAEGNITVDMHSGFFEFASFIKSNVPKIVLRVMAYGPMQLLSAEAWTKVAHAALMSRINQTGVEKYIIKNQASVDREGKLKMKEGEHSRKKTRILSQSWDWFMGLLNTFVVLDFDHPVITPILKFATVGVTTVSIGLTIYHEWDLIRAVEKKVSNFIDDVSLDVYMNPRIILKVPGMVLKAPTAVLKSGYEHGMSIWNKFRGKHVVQTYERAQCQTLLVVKDIGN